MSREVTLHVRLVAKRDGTNGYLNYVFENLDTKDPLLRYVMCTQFPNWDQKTINIKDEGFVTVRYVQAGIDTWFDGVTYIPYRNTDVHFLKFVARKPDTEFNLIVD